MTREELIECCERQIRRREFYAHERGIEPRGKVYEKNKLILKLLEQDSILDKIIAEIADLADEPTYGDYQYGFSYGLMRAAQIIDKYKAEKEI